MSRLAQQAEQEESRKARMRPFVLGAVVAVVGLVGWLMATAQRADSPPQNLQMTAGAIHVEGRDGEDDAASEVHDPLPLPIHFYELLGQGQDSDHLPTEVLEVRDLPLPPPVEPIAKPVLQPAPKPRPEPVAKASPVVKPVPVVAPEPKPEPAKPDAKVSVVPEAIPTADDDPAPQVIEKAQPDSPSVAATPPSDSPAVAAPPTSQAVERMYTLQVGSFSQQSRAEKLVNHLKKGGQDAFLVPVVLKDKGQWWRVRVGHFPSEQEAEWARLELIKLGVSPIVVRDRDARRP